MHRPEVASALVDSSLVHGPANSQCATRRAPRPRLRAAVRRPRKGARTRCRSGHHDRSVARGRVWQRQRAAVPMSRRGASRIVFEPGTHPPTRQASACGQRRHLLVGAVSRSSARAPRARHAPRRSRHAAPAPAAPTDAIAVGRQRVGFANSRSGFVFVNEPAERGAASKRQVRATIRADTLITITFGSTIPAAMRHNFTAESARPEF
jgi:hypothetical protein